MNLNYVIQLLVVGGVVGISALYMLSRVMPRWRASVAQHLQQARYPLWINAIGTRLSGNSGCGSCDTCGSCAPKKESPANDAPEHAH
jgi:hypothetical protein